MPRFTLQTFFSATSRAPDGPEKPFYGSRGAAIAKAIRQARRDNAPVDVRTDGADENERYVGTATPSPYHVKGARFSASDLRG